MTTEPESGATPPEKPVDKPASENPEAGSEKPVAAEKKTVEMSPADKPPDASAAGQKPAEAGDKPETAPAAASDKPAPAAAGDKPAAAAPAAAGDKPAVAKPAAHAKPAAPAEPPIPLEPAFFGTFLAEHGIESKRETDHSHACECIVVDVKDLEAAAKRLRNSPETQLNYLLTITGVEHPEHFESVYHLWSYANLKELVMKVKITKASVPPGQLPVVPSLANMWGAANWHERETYDLVGIRYSGHPYLRRLLNPWDWEGHPLRRDYKQPVDALNDKNPDSMR